jgi:hypothetical protein
MGVEFDFIPGLVFFSVNSQKMGKTYRHNGTDISDSADDYARQRRVQVRVADVRVVTEEAMMRHSPGFLRDERKDDED